jgi:hypothetical protein
VSSALGTELACARERLLDIGGRVASRRRQREAEGKLQIELELSAFRTIRHRVDHRQSASGQHNGLVVSEHVGRPSGGREKVPGGLPMPARHLEQQSKIGRNRRRIRSVERRERFGNAAAERRALDRSNALIERALVKRVHESVLR